MSKTSGKIRIPAIVGPTAIGKTALALALAETIPCEIISADSRQIYRYLSIGTAKPTPEELDRVPHHFIDMFTPDITYSAGEYGNEAAKRIQEILEKKKLPIIVGGSGLYIKAVAEGLFQEEETIATADIREQLELELRQKGIEPLFMRLQQVDPLSAERYADKNPRRIIRALEYYTATGIALSTAHQKSTEERPFSVDMYMPLSAREELYQRINMRTQLMFRNGIIEETEAVLAMGYSPQLNSLNTVGYKECIAYLQGDISKQQAQELTAQKTRNYAKRQLTWFKNSAHVEIFDKNAKEFANFIQNSYISTPCLM